MRHLLICFALLGLAFAPAEAVNGRLSIRLDIDAAEAALPVLERQHNGARAPRAEVRRCSSRANPAAARPRNGPGVRWVGRAPIMASRGVG